MDSDHGHAKGDPVHGVCPKRFAEVRSLFEGYVASGEELGASIVVNIDGKNVVDLWGGYADVNHTQPWKKNTITNVFSSGKTVAGLVALILADRKLIDLDAPMATYWPEFAANGKEHILVRNVLSHTSGVSGWEDLITVEDLYNWDLVVDKLAKQAPWWTPGTASGYHSFTFGYLIGELVRRTTGKSYKDFVHEELAVPLGADFQIGVQDADLWRVSDIIPPPPVANATGPPVGSISYKTLTNPPFQPPEANTAGWRHADIPAANAHTNARGIARILSSLTHGGQVGGVHVLSQPTIDRIFEQQINDTDQVVGLQLRRGIGYALTGEHTYLDWLPDGRICLWGGLGGSMMVMDLDRGMSIAYMMNKLDNIGLASNRARAYLKAVYAAFA